MSTSVAKNTIFMTIASVAQKVISFVYFVLIARMIGAESLGTYQVALAATTIFVVFVDLGFTNVLIREAAKYKDKIQKYLSSVLFAKLFLGALSYVGVIVFAHLMGYDGELRGLIYLSGITMLFDSLHLTVYGVLRARGELKYEAIGMAGSQLLTLVLGSIFIFLHLPLIFLILAFTIPAAINALFAISIAVGKFGYAVLPRYDKAMLQTMTSIAVPFALAAIFARVYSNADILIVKQYLGEAAAGWYATPYKIAYAFQFIPLALIAPLYPRFSEYFVSHKEKLARTLEQALKYLLVISVPIATGIYLLAHDITLLAFGEEYLASVEPLKIIIFGIIFSYISFPIGAFLNACSRQKTQTAIVGVAMIANIALNILLIPVLGVTGAAASALVTNILLAVLGYAIVPQVVQIAHAKIIKATIQVAIGAGIMAMAVTTAQQYLQLFWVIAIGAVVYCGVVFFVGIFERGELGELMQMIRR